jgi:hypothetical protein
MFCQIMQLLTAVVDELMNENDLLTIDGRLLELNHQCGDILDLLVQRSATVLHAECAYSP